jgi:hypothetical protein
MLLLQSGKGSIKVSVKTASGAAVPGAEVTLLVVDKAILDLMPYALQVRCEPGTTLDWSVLL